jgi:DNA invertase Pin-like site-specific DNA recombinase
MLFVLKFNSLFTDKGNCSPEAGDVLLITRLDRLARSTRDLLKVLDGAGFRTPADSWADTTTPRGRLMLTCLAASPNLKRSILSILGDCH